MTTREKLDEIEMVIHDLRTALDFKAKADSGEPFVILPTKNPVSIVFDNAKKKEVDDKIVELETELDTKFVELKAMRKVKV